MSLLLFGYAMAMYLATFIGAALVLRIPELQSLVNRFAARLPAPARSLLGLLGLT